MTTTPNPISCPVGSRTQVSAGSVNVTVQGNVGGYKVGVGSAAPASLNAGIVCYDPTGTFALSGLVSGTDNVYVQPVGPNPATVTVITS